MIRFLFKVFIAAAICFGAWNYYTTGKLFPEIEAVVSETPEKTGGIQQNTQQTKHAESQQKQTIINKDLQYMQTYMNQIGPRVPNMSAGTYAFSVPSGQRVEYTIKKENPFYCPKAKKTLHRNISFSITKPPTY